MIFGVLTRTDEIALGIESGAVIKAWVMHRLAGDDRWDHQMIQGDRKSSSRFEPESHLMGDPANPEPMDTPKAEGRDGLTVRDEARTTRGTASHQIARVTKRSAREGGSRLSVRIAGGW